MTTYNVNITNNSDFSYNFYDQTAKEVKSIKSRYASNKAMKVTATKIVKTYYRGEEVEVIEKQYMGWTLVTAAGKSAFRAVTAELEYR